MDPYRVKKNDPHDFAWVPGNLYPALIEPPGSPGEIMGTPNFSLAVGDTSAERV